MCVVVDANRASVVLGGPVPDDYKPVIDWISRRGGRLVYGGSKFKQELARVRAAALLVQNWRSRGLAIEIAEAEIAAELTVVETIGYGSDDPHVIALVRASGARTVVTGDADLMLDLTNPRLVSRPRAKIYRSPGHGPLLAHTVSCGVLSGQRRRRT